MWNNGNFYLTMPGRDIFICKCTYMIQVNTKFQLQMHRKDMSEKQQDLT